MNSLIWFVRYPNGTESVSVSYQEAKLLAETYGGGIHREWTYGHPPKRISFSLKPLVRMFAI